MPPYFVLNAETDLPWQFACPGVPANVAPPPPPPGGACMIASEPPTNPSAPCVASPKSLNRVRTPVRRFTVQIPNRPSVPLQEDKKMVTFAATATPYGRK